MLFDLGDKASGFLGMRSLGDTNYRVRTELNAYKVEIEFVLKLKIKDEIEVVSKLKENFKNELDYLTNRGILTDKELIEQINIFLK